MKHLTKEQLKKDLEIRDLSDKTQGEHCMQLIMNEVAKLDAGDTKGKIKVLEKYYRDITLDAGQLKTDYSQITKNTDKIFQTGVIKGVPFIFEE